MHSQFNTRGKRATRSRRLRLESLENRRLLTTYYLDATDGNDSDPGTSPETAWASIAKINDTQLVAGDEVRLRKGSVWGAGLTLSDSGTSLNPIRVTTYGDGLDPILFQLTVSGHNLVVDGLTIDHGRQSGDAVRIRDSSHLVLREMEIRNGASDGIDIDDTSDLILDGLHIHHFLAGSFTNQIDAHGVVATDTSGLVIRNTEIHHVSGDSFQSDPDRNRQVSTEILIEDSHLWTAPLDADFNQWNTGESPGENAIDTKVVKDNWDTVSRMSITVRNVVANGWTDNDYISNRAAFNIKEKVEAVFDRVTVHDNEIGFRLRGNRGNANVTISNAVMYDLNKAIRAEDDLANLKVYHSTFGDEIATDLQFAGGDGGTGSWDWKNNAFLDGSRPTVAPHSSNRVVSGSEFFDAASDNYQLTSSSSLVDQAVSVPGVDVDRLGVARPQGDGSDIGAYELPLVVAATPPKVEAVIVNDGSSQRSIVDEIKIQFDSVIDVDATTADAFEILNRDTGAIVDSEARFSISDGKSVVTLQFFAGASVIERSDKLASLADGNYQLTINSNGISSNGAALDGDGDGHAGGDYHFGERSTDQFFRFFGDADGDRDVDGPDYGRFGLAFLSSSLNSPFDFDGDGDVDGQDYGRFGLNYLRQLEF